MRITTPSHDAQVDLAQVDLAATGLYVDGDAHQVWRALRTERPVFWNRAPAGTGFWAVTRYPDVRRVLRDHDTFSSEQGTALDMIGAHDPAAGKMMHATDPPCHGYVREPMEQPLSARAVADYSMMVRSTVRDTILPTPAPGSWDAAAALARLPVAVMLRLMNLPSRDLDFLLHAAYASVAPRDPNYRTGSVVSTLRWAHSSAVGYFARSVRARRKALASDLLSHIITMQVSRRQLTEEEVVVNCYSLLVGGVVTTAQVMSASLVALAEQGGGRGHWPPGLSMLSFVEEALRWASPTTHFMRHARRNLVLHGQQIKAGDPVTAWIASANRDEQIFDRPFAFDSHRRPNRHIAFGTGPHRCVGRQLARTILRETYDYLRATIGNFEMVDAPTHLASNLIAGIVRLPIGIPPNARHRSDPPPASPRQRPVGQTPRTSDTLPRVATTAPPT